MVPLWCVIEILVCRTCFDKTMFVVLRFIIRKTTSKLKYNIFVCQGRSETGNKQHSLVCFVNNFCPPPVQVKWTKNDENVPKGGKVGQYATNSDYTFYRFSPLTFEPQEGDIYTCIVDHTALDEPLTRT
uniref:Ig-like domain-containing protein n=1 Tax=Hucho hucho TaxID=62062 RepID=A0A4W5JV68_9TELE